MFHQSCCLTTNIKTSEARGGLLPSIGKKSHTFVPGEALLDLRIHLDGATCLVALSGLFP